MSKACPWVYMRPCLRGECEGWTIKLCPVKADCDKYPEREVFLTCPFKATGKCIYPGGYCEIVHPGGINVNI
jgi:hypothetical protein